MTTENIIVNRPEVQANDANILFDNEPVHYTNCNEIPDLLVELGVYSSKSQARRTGREGKIPEGWTHAYKASKKHYLWVWNPSE